MSVLLKEIRRMDSGAAFVLEQAKFSSDSEIQTLTREDLHELFPGREKLKLRRTIFETIHKQKPIQMLLKELQAFIPQESFRAALTSHGVLVDYLHMLKDMRTQLNNVQSFLDAHVDFLQSLSKDGSEQQQGQGSSGGGHSDIQKPNISEAHSSGSATDGWKQQTNYKNGEASSEKTQTSMNTGGIWSMFGLSRTETTTAKVTQNTGSRYERNPFDTNPQRRQVRVNYKMVVSGKTFGADQQILNQIQGIPQQLNLVDVDKSPPSGDYHVKFVFCPVVSRVGTDVEAAMKEAEGSGPVILVLMHHSHEAKHVPSFKTWENVKVCANVFYHEKVNGLIYCKENDNAISAIRNELLNHFGTYSKEH